MHRITATVSIAACALMLFTGCAAVQSPLVGAIYTNVEAAVTATSNSGSTKIGTASATSILGIVATGDASIQAAVRNGGITRIHHVDYKSQSVLGIYAKFTTTVYGEQRKSCLAAGALARRTSQSPRAERCELNGSTDSNET